MSDDNPQPEQQDNLEQSDNLPDDKNRPESPTSPTSTTGESKQLSANPPPQAVDDDTVILSVPSTAQLPQTGPLLPGSLNDNQPTKRIWLSDIKSDSTITAPDAIRPEEGLALFLPDNTVPIVFKDRDMITIGRTDKAANIIPELDLTPYHGAALGVSRYHAVITRVNNAYHIKDMGSTNGTRINGKKIPPYTLTPLASGDQIRVGHLTIVVG